MHKTYYIFFLIILMFALACDQLDISSDQSNTFVKLYGASATDIGNDIKSLNDRYIILATVTSQQGNTDIALIQTDKFGKQQKMDTLSMIRGGNNIASELLLTSDGGFMVIGTVDDTTGNKQTDIYIAKFSSNLELEWEKNLGTESNEMGHSIKNASSGYIIAGCTDAQDLGNGNNRGFKDIYLVKIDATGEVEWAENYGGNGDDYANEVIPFYTGYILVGTTNSFNEPGQSNDNILIVKTNLYGSSTPSDRITYGANNNDYGSSIIKVDGGYVILGTVENSIGDNSNILVVKVEENIHNVVWNEEFESNVALGNEIIKIEGGYIIVGSTELPNGTAGYFIKMDQNGEKILENTYGGYGQRINAIESTNDGGYIMVGSSGYVGNEMIYVVKVNSEGEL